MEYNKNMYEIFVSMIITYFRNAALTLPSVHPSLKKFVGLIPFISSLIPMGKREQAFNEDLQSSKAVDFLQKWHLGHTHLQALT